MEVEVSDTPRTDGAQWGTGKVTTDFAKSLEREITRLRGEVMEAWHEGYQWIDYVPDHSIGAKAKKWNNSRAKRVAEGKA